MKLFSFFLCAAIALIFIACGDKNPVVETTVSSFSLDSVKAQIAASNAMFGECFAKNDSAGFVS